MPPSSPGPFSHSPLLLQGPYKIVVHTSDIKFAGTDANVFIEIFGDK